jgi:hypothetical protein
MATKPSLPQMGCWYGIGANRMLVWYGANGMLPPIVRGVRTSDWNMKEGDGEEKNDTGREIAPRIKLLGKFMQLF